MRETKRKLKLSWILGAGLLAAAGRIIWAVPPETWLTEAAVIILAGLGMWLILAAVWPKRTAGLAAFGLITMALLNRLGAMEPLTVLLLAAVLAGLAVI